MKRVGTDDRIDIISVSHSFFPKVGGLENIANLLVKLLNDKGYRCAVLHGGDEDSVYHRKEYVGYSFKALSPFRNYYPIFFLKLPIRIITLLRKNPSSLVLIHDRHLNSSLVTAIICKILGKKYILFSHTTNSNYFDSKLLQFLGNIYEKVFSSFVLSNAAQIISSSVSNADFLIDKFGVDKNRIEVIPNTIDETAQPLSKKKERKVIFAARLIPVKNPMLVYKAFQHLSRKYHMWDFIFIGEGDYTQSMGASTSINLIVHNKFLTRDRLLELLSRSAIYVNASFDEGLSLGVLEAIKMCNVPVLSDAPSNVELAEAVGSKEFLFSRDKISDLVSKLELAIKAFEKNGNKLGSSYSDVLNRKYSYQSTKDNYLEVIAGNTDGRILAKKKDFRIIE